MIRVHEDGDDFSMIEVEPDHGRIMLVELERFTTDSIGVPRLGAHVRAIVEALRRSGQSVFAFDPADASPMRLSEEWVLHAREALQDAIWFLSCRALIAEARRKSGTRFVWSFDPRRVSFAPSGIERSKLHPWVCPDCARPAQTWADVCATPGCPSHERFARCTGRPVPLLSLPAKPAAKSA